MVGKLILYKYLTVTIAITTGKKEVLVVFLAGARSLLRPEKSSSRLSGGCAIAITTGYKKSSRLSGGCAIATISTTGPIYAKSSDFYAKLNVSNLNV